MYLYSQIIWTNITHWIWLKHISIELVALSSGRGNDESNEILELEERIARTRTGHQDCYFYLAGDLNARAVDLSDSIPDDYLDFVFYSFNMPRNTRDTYNTNNYGRSLIEFCDTRYTHC